MRLATGLLLAALSGAPLPLAEAAPPRASVDRDGPGEEDYRHRFMMGAGTSPRGIYLFLATLDRCDEEGPPRFEPTMDCRLFLVPFRTGRLGGTGTRLDPSRFWLPTRGIGLVVEAWSSPAFWKSLEEF